MAITIEKSFEVDRPVEDVWEFLVDPERVVSCLPGAEIVEQVDERTYRGEVGLKLGPIGVTFQGTVHFDELDEEAHSVTMSGDAKDRRGSGSVKMEMKSDLSAREGGGTRVEVSQSVNLSGKLASFGRGGIVQNVADHQFQRFVDCVKEKLEGG